MDMWVSIANTCGFWGDRIDASLELIQTEPQIDYLTLDYLSEMSLSIMAVQREKNPKLGYAKDFEEVIASLVDEWNRGKKFKVVTNAGGLNPFACAESIKKILDGKLKRKLKIGIVSGDDVLSHFPGYATANAYLGAGPIIQALLGDADIVITGRVADPSLTVACAAFHFGWKSSDYDLIAQATAAGHLIECGTQVTGGLSSDWLSKKIISYPVSMLNKSGDVFIKKPADLQSVKEQLVYEMGDPEHYLSPDATVNFLGVNLEDKGDIYISGMKGSAPPPTYKVSASLRKGWQTESMIGLVGGQLVEKGEKVSQFIQKRLEKRGYKINAIHTSLIGINGLSPYLKSDSFEAYLRVALWSEEQEAVNAFTRELAPFVTCGPMGVCAYATGRSSVRPYFAYVPKAIEVSLVEPEVGFLEAGWAN
jgi:hypothetical protein